MRTTIQERWYYLILVGIIIDVIVPYIGTMITYIVKGVGIFHWYQNFVALFTQANSTNITTELILSSIGSILFLFAIFLLIIVKKPSRDVADIIAPFLLKDKKDENDDFNKRWKLYKSFYIGRIILFVGAIILFISALII